MLYSLVRVLIDILTIMSRDRSDLAAELLALRRQVQVLERQIKRAKWTPGDRMVIAALRRLMPKEAWDGLLVKPETVLGWHRELLRRKWAAYRGRPVGFRKSIEFDAGPHHRQRSGALQR